MKIVFATAELSPWYKVGGLGDVSAALPAALAELGHDVRVFVPLHDLAEPSRLGATEVEAVRDVVIPIAGRRDSFHLFERAPQKTGEAHLYFVQCAPFFERGGSVYTWHEDESRRFVFFMRAILESLQRLKFAPDILHANDWSTGLLPLLLKTRYAWDALFHHTRTVFTIHNLAYQGVFGAQAIADLDLGAGLSFLDAADLKADRVNFLKCALQLSDRITTVSPSYAQEIRSEAFGAGLDELLRQRAADLQGILNGVDTEVWHPRVDCFLPARYDAESLWRKDEDKIALMQRAGMEVVIDRPLFGLIARLVEQKGIDLLCAFVEEFLLREDAALVLLGQGEPRYREVLESMAQRNPDRVCLWSAFDEEFAHLIEAGSDFFLMPSRFEPCGLNQMYSQLYGTLPIVHAVGGLRDTVEPIVPGGACGTGIVFDEPSAEALEAAMQQAVQLHRDPVALEAARRRAMDLDWSWRPRAEEYVQLYEELLVTA